jgi:MYXO-CTERM domain-containing protein
VIVRRLVLGVAVASATTATAQPVTGAQIDNGDPAVVALVTAGDQVVCTASVIGPHTGITAAHCVQGFDPRTLRIFLGTTIGDGGAFVAVSDARIHPGFDPGGRDVAVFTLRDDPTVTPLVVDPGPLDTTLVGTSLHVVGFGLTAAGVDDAGSKRDGMAQVAAVGAEELVAVPGPSLTCLGDSGGPGLLAGGTLAGVVSRVDSSCSDHAVYTRVDIARSVLIDPYVADTAPRTASTGDACFYDEHCADGPCLQAADDPLLYFCSRACTHDSECPAAMQCAADGCRYPEPSPGALGGGCDVDADCTTGSCLDHACTRSCETLACPVGFSCERARSGDYQCVVPDGGCGCTSGGAGASAWWAFGLGAVISRRRWRRQRARGR